jgi:hypothetical protein
MTRSLYEEEFQQLKALVYNLDRRKQAQHSEAQGITNDKENDDNMEEDSLPFDEVNNAIIAFVKSKRQKEQDPGPNQNEIVEYIKNNYHTRTGTSRVSVLNRLKYLVNYKALIERPDSKNRQTKRYYFNEESLLLEIQVFFDEFEDAIVSLVNAFLEKKGPSTSYAMSEESSSFFWFVFRLYQHVSNIVAICLTLEWPKRTNDTILLDKLSRVVFAKLIKLQDYLSSALYIIGGAPNDNFFSDAWMLTGEVISKGKEVERRLKLPLERVNQVLKLSWKIGAPFVKSASTKLGIEVTDSNTDELTSEDGWISLYIHWLGQQPKGPFI